MAEKDKDKKKKKKVNIIIKKVVDEGHHGHHGGAWKVAYADFVTAMMAFFLLLWILNSVQEETLEGLADYFTPTMSQQDGVGGEGLLSGGTLGPDGTLNSSNSPLLTIAIPVVGVDPDEGAEKGESKDQKEEPSEMIVEYEQNLTLNDGDGDKNAVEAAEKVADAAEKAMQQKLFANLETRILQSIADAPDLEPLAESISFEQTPEGLRIQIIDQDGKEMFASGSPDLNASTRKLIELVGQAVSTLPNEMVITGHTDSIPMRKKDYTNWELSADRANSTRRALLDAGVTMKQIARVSGVADNDPLRPMDPTHPSNRRISIVLMYQDAKSESDMDRNMISYNEDEVQGLEVSRPVLDEPVFLEPNEEKAKVIDPDILKGREKKQIVRPVRGANIITLDELQRAYDASEPEDGKKKDGGGGH